MSGLTSALTTASADPDQLALLVNAAIVLAVLGYVLHRQFSIKPLTTRTFLLVAILFFYGISSGLPTAGLGVGLLLVSVLVSIGFGVWRGVSMRIWRASDGIVYHRGTALTITLWAITVAIKIALDGYQLSVTHTITAGPIWLAMAVTLAVQQYVMTNRAKALTTG